MQPFIPDNTSGQRIMEERSIGGMFRQDRFQQLHLQSLVKCNMAFKAYEEMGSLVSMLNAEAQIPTRLGMERDLERCLEHGREEMKLALASHPGKFAFTVATKVENDGADDHMAITAHWCTPDFRLVSALLGFQKAVMSFDLSLSVPKATKTYADFFQDTLESYGIWPRVSHITWVDGGVDEMDDLVKDLAERIPGFSLEHNVTMDVMAKINAAMRRLQPIPTYGNFMWNSEISDDPRMKKAVFKDSLIMKYKEQGPRLFYEDDEVSAAFVFPRIEELVKEVTRYKNDESRPDEQMVKLKRTHNELLKRHEILRNTPAYYIILLLNPRIKDQHYQKWNAKWRDPCETQLQKIWETYKAMDEPTPVPRAIPEAPEPKPKSEEQAHGEQPQEGEEDTDDEMWISPSEYIAQQQRKIVNEWKDKLYASMTENTATDDDAAGIEDELERYRKAPIVPLNEWKDTFGCKAHNWWAAVGQFKFPRVAAMARDFLAIQATVYPAYDAFEKAANYDSKREDYEEITESYNWVCQVISPAAQAATMLDTWWTKDVLGKDAALHVPLGMRAGIDDMANANESPFSVVGTA